MACEPNPIPHGKIRNESSFQDDQTYETQSRIAFVASRFENGELITCEANNPVLEAYNEEPERASVTVQVKCECISVKVTRMNLSSTKVGRSQDRNCFRTLMLRGEFRFGTGMRVGTRSKERMGKEKLPPFSVPSIKQGKRGYPGKHFPYKGGRCSCRVESGNANLGTKLTSNKQHF